MLFAIQEKHSAEEEMYSYRLTREIGIYDVEQACVTAQWGARDGAGIRLGR